MDRFKRSAQLANGFGFYDFFNGLTDLVIKLQRIGGFAYPYSPPLKLTPSSVFRSWSPRIIATPFGWNAILVHLWKFSHLQVGDIYNFVLKFVKWRKKKYLVLPIMLIYSPIGSILWVVQVVFCHALNITDIWMPWLGSDLQFEEIKQCIKTFPPVLLWLPLLKAVWEDGKFHKIRRDIRIQRRK